jgi:hypothetical protein
MVFRIHDAHKRRLLSAAKLNPLARQAGLALPEETSTTAARAELKRVHINIFDLVEERFEPVFPSVKELHTYTTKNGKIFPKAAAKKDGALKLFLRVLFGRSGGGANE